VHEISDQEIGVEVLNGLQEVKYGFDSRVVLADESKEIPRVELVIHWPDDVIVHGADTIIQTVQAN